VNKPVGGGALWAAALLFLLALTPSPASAQPICLRIGAANNGIAAIWQPQMAEKIFAKAGICLKLMTLPQARINAMEDSGDLDGDIARSPAYLATRPYLVKVPTPILDFTVGLFWPAGSARPSSEGTPVGALQGPIWTQQYADALGLRLYQASSYDSLFYMLQTGRLQGMIAAKENFEKLMRDQPERGRYNSTDLGGITLYIALNRRHEHFVPALDSAVKAALADGTIAAIKATVNP